MIEIIPAINCELHDGDAVVTKLRKAEEFAKWVHLDVADGVFTFSKSWGDPEAWREMHPQIKVEVHLMVEHPERVVQDWLNAGINRIIVHYEAFPQTKTKTDKLREYAFAEITERAHHAGAEIMLAINPETTLVMAEPFFKYFDSFQIFSQAHAGPSGQKFLPTVLPKITALREQYADATIEVDGGIKLETGQAAVRAGANALAAGSFIFSAKDPKANFKLLRSLDEKA
ncbi:MAG: hypothetical protein V1489_01785 [Candidatus Liptonbacteria bacterium]